MLKTLKVHHVSFKHAFDGVIYAFTTQPNFRVHLIFSAIALISGILLSISYIEMLIILFTIVLGLIAEMINTSIEAVTDLVSKETSMEAKIAKDVAAGMMLLTAIGALGVAVAIFLPKIINLFHIL